MKRVEAEDAGDSLLRAPPGGGEVRRVFPSPRMGVRTTAGRWPGRGGDPRGAATSHRRINRSTATAIIIRTAATIGFVSMDPILEDRAFSRRRTDADLSFRAGEYVPLRSFPWSAFTRPFLSLVKSTDCGAGVFCQTASPIHVWAEGNRWSGQKSPPQYRQWNGYATLVPQKSHSAVMRLGYPVGIGAYNDLAVMPGSGRIECIPLAGGPRGLKAPVPGGVIAIPASTRTAGIPTHGPSEGGCDPNSHSNFSLSGCRPALVAGMWLSNCRGSFSGRPAGKFPRSIGINGPQGSRYLRGADIPRSAPSPRTSLPLRVPPSR